MNHYIDVGFIQRCRHDCTVNEIVFLDTIETERSHTLICSSDKINVKYKNYPKVKKYLTNGKIKPIVLSNILPRINKNYREDIINSLSMDTIEELTISFVVQYSFKVGTLKDQYAELFVILGHRLIVHYLMDNCINENLLFDLAYYTNIDKLDGRGYRLYRIINELIDYERTVNRRKLLNQL